MKTAAHKIFFVFALLIFVGLSALICSKAKEQRLTISCKGIKVNVDSPCPFVSEEDVKDYLSNYYGAYIGERIDSINLALIERVLNRQGAIRESQAYSTSDGFLHINIKEMVPVVRFQNSSFGFYADPSGNIFPLQKAYSPLVPVVTGEFPIVVGQDYKGAPPTQEGQEWMKNFLTFLQVFSGNKLWANNVSEIHIERNGDYVVIVREGPERFIFGNTSDAQDKLSKIESYYKYIRPSKPLGYYRSVNLKYKDQIICRK